MTAPDRIWIDAWGGNWSPRSGGTQELEYVRRDPAVLAALPEVQAMVEEAIKYAVEAESRPWASICRNQGGSTICAEMCGFCAAAIRAKGGDA